jgi:hypothetical protein
MKHPRAELIAKWLEDTTQLIWAYIDFEWVGSDRETLIKETQLPFRFFVGPKPTEPPQKMCTLAGVSFPVPTLQHGQLGLEEFEALEKAVLCLYAGQKEEDRKQSTELCVYAIRNALEQAIKEAT